MISLLVEYLSIFYQTGDTAQLAVIARSLLAAIPDDLVALQFLGMALYQMGRIDDAYRVFKQVATKQDPDVVPGGSSDCQSASVISYREATEVHPGLADGWHQIAEILNKFGFQPQADRAYQAAAASRGLKSQSS
ncbi:MAG: tetratricopeptide repeat protein [Rhodocyclaceae bacterium]|nr:MAG: tetratricopeptide repeat protein [Rhodocyclaceae bacterium]